MLDCAIKPDDYIMAKLYSLVLFLNKVVGSAGVYPGAHKAKAGKEGSTLWVGRQYIAGHTHTLIFEVSLIDLIMFWSVGDPE